jgi:hypothetical protein
LTQRIQNSRSWALIRETTLAINDMVIGIVLFAEVVEKNWGESTAHPFGEQVYRPPDRMVV